MTAEDAVEMMLAGATAISIGTANFRNPAVTAEIYPLGHPIMAIRPHHKVYPLGHPIMAIRPHHKVYVLAVFMSHFSVTSQLQLIH